MDQNELKHQYVPEGHTTGIRARLRNFPITFFAIVLGFAGFTLAVQKGEGLLGLSPVTSRILLIATLALFALITLSYLVKAIVYFNSVREEINNPVKINFFPLISKIMLVLSVVYLSVDMNTSKVLWIAGTILQFLFSILIISTWLHHSHFKIEHLTPAWFIPIVGFVIVPIAGIPHGFIELSWFAFAVGLVFWLVLFVVVFYRMIFHAPIVQKLLPTLFILFAPPAIAFIAWSKLSGGLDPFGRILFYVSLFIFALVLYRVRIFFKIRFYLSWWAYSFPLSAITLAAVQMYHLSHLNIFRYLAFFTLILLAATIGILLVFTGVHIARKDICLEEE